MADERLHVLMDTHRYAVISGWNRVPLGHISQLAVDSTGRVYVFQRTGAPIVVLTPDGELAASWDEGVMLGACRVIEPACCKEDRKNSITAVLPSTIGLTAARAEVPLAGGEYRLGC